MKLYIYHKVQEKSQISRHVSFHELPIIDIKISKYFCFITISYSLILTCCIHFLFSVISLHATSILACFKIVTLCPFCVELCVSGLKCKLVLRSDIQHESERHFLPFPMKFLAFGVEVRSKPRKFSRRPTNSRLNFTQAQKIEPILTGLII